MPYDFLPLVLGSTFFVVWFFIAATQMHDKLQQARAKRVAEGAGPPHYSRRRRSRRGRRDRAVANA